MRKLALLIAVFTPVPLLAAGAPRSRGPAVPVVKIDSAVAKFMSRHHVPGVSLVIVQDGRVVVDKAYGFSDLENSVRAKPPTVYRLASVSKPITAVAVMQLVEAGKLDLDAPIGRYIPTLPPALHRIALKDLLRHTGGVRHYRGAEFESTAYCPRLSDGLATFAAHPLEHEPGVKQTYSTYGYTLLGLAVEAASRARFADYLRDHIFEPAGMTASRADDVHALIMDRSMGYAVSRGGEIVNTDLADTSCKLPGGGLVSTAEDMAKFDLALERGALISIASLAMMDSNQLSARTIQASFPSGLPPYAGYGYGYGWIVGTARRSDAVWHGGIGKGSTTILYRLPSRRIAIIVLSNLEAQGEEITTLADDLADAVAPR